MEELYKNWNALLRAERKARASKLRRFFYQPFLYPALMIYDHILYPWTQKGIDVRIKTFFGLDMKTLLPAGTDILLHRIKAHDSEIRFAKFMTRHLQEGDVFIDVGAHYGYYSLLAYSLVGPYGKIYAVEASAHSARILKENVQSFNQIRIIQAAASHSKGEVIFYEYPGPYAESNTMVKDAYTHQKWFRKVKQIENRVPTVTLDDLIREEQISSAMIKIDAEGGEFAVIQGLKESLKHRNLTLVMEYLLSDDLQSPHHQALELLFENGYKAHSIDIHGQTHIISNADQHLMKSSLVSDNLVFTKEITV